MKPIILLDLNYTLVANSETKKAPFIRQIEQEEYRSDLIRLVLPFHVILITARPEKYKDATLDNIMHKTNWLPDEAYFNDTNLAPQFFKRNIILDNLGKRYPLSSMIAIESNPKTIAEYHKLEILCLSIQ